MSDSSPSKKATYIAAYCKVCNTRVTPKAKFAGRRIKCPDCFSSIQLPTVEQYQKKQEAVKLRETVQPVDQEPYAIQAPIDLPETPPVRVFEEMATIHNVREKPEPPERPFFSNVFQFPWSDITTTIKWGILSAGLSISISIALLCIWIIQENGLAGAIPVLLFSMTQVGILVWTMSHGSAFMFAIIHDTGAALDKVESWPQEGVIACFSELVTFSVAFLMSGFFSYVITLPIQYLTGLTGPPVLIVQTIIFPATLLSSLDADSIFMPYSELTLRSFVRIPRSWLMFYGLLMGVWLTVTAILVSMAYFSVLSSGIASGPVLATGMFISARLMGRLAWLIGDNASELANKDDD